jgi:hypothetical protein
MPRRPLAGRIVGALPATQNGLMIGTHLLNDVLVPLRLMHPPATGPGHRPTLLPHNR